MAHKPHPTRATPLTKAQFRSGFDRLWAVSGLRCAKKITFPKELTSEHCRNSRRYAQVFWVKDSVTFEFAAQTLWLPDPYVVGLIAHEIGHVLVGRISTEHTENDADAAAQIVLGIRIDYDKKNFPGKGLQIAL